MRVVAFRSGLLLAALAVAGPRLAHAEGATPASSSAPPATASAAPLSPPSASAATPPNPEPPALDTRAKCVLDHEQTQIARMKEALLAARASALSCSQAACPALLRTDCVEWFAELDREVPSVVISVRAGSNDVSTAGVRIDGKAVSRALDGQLLELDPGPHLVEVLPAGQPVLSREVVLAAGEKARLIVFELPNAAPLAPAAPVKSAPRPTHRPVPPLTWVLSGTAVAALGVGSVFGGLAIAQRNELERKPASGGCSPYCTDAQVATVHHLTLGADVAFGVAAASAVSAALSYFFRPEEPLAAGHLQLDFGFLRDSATFGLRGDL